MMALTECFHYMYFSYSYRFVNGFDLFPLMVSSVTVTVNLNHTDHDGGIGGSERRFWLTVNPCRGGGRRTCKGSLRLAKELECANTNYFSLQNVAAAYYYHACL